MERPIESVSEGGDALNGMFGHGVTWKSHANGEKRREGRQDGSVERSAINDENSGN